MKCNKKLAVFIQGKNKKTYNVYLCKSEVRIIFDLILDLHNGKIRVFPENFDCLQWIDERKKRGDVKV